jgi:hypothetical protein
MVSIGAERGIVKEKRASSPVLRPPGVPPGANAGGGVDAAFVELSQV